MRLAKNLANGLPFMVCTLMMWSSSMPCSGAQPALSKRSVAARLGDEVMRLEAAAAGLSHVGTAVRDGGNSLALATSSASTSHMGSAAPRLQQVTWRRQGSAWERQRNQTRSRDDFGRRDGV